MCVRQLAKFPHACTKYGKEADMAIYSRALQITLWYLAQIAARSFGFMFINYDPNLYEKYKPFWGAPVWACWVAWIISAGLEGYAIWAVIDAQGTWTYRATLYMVYLGATALWPIFFFPAVKDKFRGMMWMTVILTMVALGLSGFLIWAFWDAGGAVPGAFMIPSTVWLLYAFPLTVVTVMKANYLDVGDADRTPKQRARMRREAGESTELVDRTGTASRRYAYSSSPNTATRQMYSGNRHRSLQIPPPDTDFQRKHGRGACEAGRTAVGDVFFGVRPINGRNPAYCGGSDYQDTHHR